MKFNPFDYLAPGAKIAPGAKSTRLSLFLKKTGVKFDSKSGTYSKDARTLSDALREHIILIEKKIGESRTKYIYNFHTGSYEIFDTVNYDAVLRAFYDQLADITGPIWTPMLHHELMAYQKTWPLRYERQLNHTNHIVFKNESYDLVDFRVVQHSPEQLSTCSLEYAYDENAKCPLFISFLHTISCSRPDLELLIQEMVGSTLVTHNKAEKSFIIVGPGRNGKSVFSSVIRGLLGPDNVSATPLNKMAGGDFGLEDLVDKKINLTTESSKSEQISTATWKQLVSNDPVSVNPKGKKRYTAQLNLKIISFLNYFPDFSELDFAVQRRLIVIPFDAVIAEKDIDPDLSEKLQKELPGIMNWAIEGLKRLSSNKWQFTKAESSENLLRTLVLESNPLRKFISECIEKDPAGTQSVKLKVFHDAYDQFALVNDLPLIGKSFNNDFEDELSELKIPYMIVKPGNCAAVKGIKLKEN